jgi:hypothetical protein
LRKISRTRRLGTARGQSAKAISPLYTRGFSRASLDFTRSTSKRASRGKSTAVAYVIWIWWTRQITPTESSFLPYFGGCPADARLNPCLVSMPPQNVAVSETFIAMLAGVQRVVKLVSPRVE